MKKTQINEVRQLQKIAGLLKEDQDMTQVYDAAISYAYEMTPEYMYEAGEFGDDVESPIQADEEFEALLRAEQINPSSTLAYLRFFENAYRHAKRHGATDLEDFKAWFRDSAVKSSAYQENFETIM